MALTLDATVGGLSSNAYLTEAEGDSYHESRLFSTVWTGASSGDKEAAIVWATRTLDDSLIWHGFISEQVQALGWPRAGVVDRESRNVENDIIPQAVKDATAELARTLIAADRSADRDTIGFKKLKVGPLELEIDKFDEISIIPDSSFDLVREFADRISEVAVRLVRV